MSAGQVRIRLVLVRHVPERLRAAQGGLRRAAADPELEPAVADQVRGGCLLGHVEGVLVAHVDHRGADLDPACAGADRREQRERRGQLAREVVDAHECAVDPDLLGGDCELDRLDQRVSRGSRLRAGGVLPVAEGEEADARHAKHPTSHPREPFTRSRHDS